MGQILCLEELNRFSPLQYTSCSLNWDILLLSAHSIILLLEETLATDSSFMEDEKKTDKTRLCYI